MNILLTSAGRRTYMVEYFKKALGGGGLVFASNSRMSPALEAADGYFISPVIYDDAYIPFLKDICEKNSIGMLISLFDADLPVLSAHKKEFEALSTRAIVSDPDTVSSCNDKYAMFLTLWKGGIRCPETKLSVDDALLGVEAMTLAFPVMVKPRFGMGSIGILKAYDKAELKAAYSMCRRKVFESYLKYESEPHRKEAVIIQEILDGNEYGLDVICDFDGNYLKTIVRKKIAMRSGETDEAVILGRDDKEYGVLAELGMKLAVLLSPAGLIDVDVIMNTSNMLPYVIDINLRFGGGYPFSHIAGADVPKAYVLMHEGKRDDARKYLEARPGVHGYKEIVMKSRSIMNADGAGNA